MLGKLYSITLAVNPSFMSQPFQRYSTSNTTYGDSPRICIGNPDVDNIGDAIADLSYGNAAITLR